VSSRVSSRLRSRSLKLSNTWLLRSVDQRSIRLFIKHVRTQSSRSYIVSLIMSFKIIIRLDVFVMGQMVRSWLAFRRGRVDPLQDAEMPPSDERKTPSVSCLAQFRNVFRLRYMRHLCYCVSIFIHRVSHLRIRNTENRYVHRHVRWGKCVAIILRVSPVFCLLCKYQQRFAIESYAWHISCSFLAIFTFFRFAVGKSDRRFSDFFLVKYTLQTTNFSIL